jgi:hypothetical protein
VADLHADTGRPMPAEIQSDPDSKFHELPTTARQVSLRNTGVNTLWVSFDQKAWFDVACGTSWDDRVNVPGFWHRTQIGRTSLVVNALALNHLGVRPAEDHD